MQTAKKPKTLKKATPIRKRLQPTIDQMLDDDPIESDERVSPRKKKRKVIAYDDIYARKESDKDTQTNSIQKMRQLQENELQCIMDQGTYVQCCECNKWRLGLVLYIYAYIHVCRMVKEFEDPSLVPEYWVCSMNQVLLVNCFY